MALKNRFELRMGDDMSNALDHLAKDLRLDRADVIRRALALYTEVKSDDDNQVFLKNVKANKTIKIVNI